MPNMDSLAKKSINLSVVILTKNEEKKIVKAIKSANFADEVIVYDCGSTDKTAEIASSTGARVYIDPVWQGFGKQRNKAQKKAKFDWIFMLDSDEVITPKLKKSIKKAIKKAKKMRFFKSPALAMFLVVLFVMGAGILIG